MKKVHHLVIAAMISIPMLYSCSGGSSSGMQDAGGGGSSPEDIAKSYEALGAIDEAKAEKGKEVFTSKCSSCHQLDSKAIGPALRGVTKRRSADWVGSMLSDPQGFVQSNEEAKKLFEEYNKIPMVIPGGITDEEKGAVIEYLRKEG